MSTIQKLQHAQELYNVIMINIQNLDAILWMIKFSSTVNISKPSKIVN